MFTTHCKQRSCGKSFKIIADLKREVCREAVSLPVCIPFHHIDTAYFPYDLIQFIPSSLFHLE